MSKPLVDRVFAAFGYGTLWLFTAYMHALDWLWSAPYRARRRWRTWRSS